jgi:peptidoglycan/LPS O-acetylase OafA/YrhL
MASARFLQSPFMQTPSQAATGLVPARSRATLAAFATGHDNNLNLVRVVAAMMVLVSHAFVLASGRTAAEPWLAHLGTTPGGLAVGVFFAVSGFLVTGSLERSRSLHRFAAARALRIYPALWVSLLLTLGLVGLWFTELSPGQFFRDPQTWRWLGKNAVMLTGESALPGAFAHVPFAAGVNGSLWTLCWELRLYLLLGLAWWCARLVARRHAAITFERVTIAAAVAFTAANVALHLAGREIDYVELAATFLQGSALWTLRGRVSIGWGTFLALASAYAISALVSVQAFQFVNALGLAWLTLHLAFLPAGWLRCYNRVGDYSYGIYIFAFPIQQAWMASLPGLGPLGLAAIAVPPTLALAALSWHLMEKRALAHKESLARRMGASARGGGTR